MTTKTPEQHREVLREFAKNPLTRKILLIDVMDAITYLLAVTEPAQIDEAVKFPPCCPTPQLSRVLARRKTMIEKTNAEGQNVGSSALLGREGGE